VVAGVVAGAWALVSMADAILVLFVSVFSVAVLSPVVAAMERRLGGAGRCAPRCSC
jgi:predicted PurR-regulated permease PerM